MTHSQASIASSTAPRDVNKEKPAIMSTPNAPIAEPHAAIVAPMLDLNTAIRGLQAIRQLHHLVAINPDTRNPNGASFDLGTPDGEKLCREWIARWN